MPAVHSQVYARLKAPMLTLMAGGVFEQGYVCLKHIVLLASRAPEIFADQFKHFYVRYNEPACVRLLKLEILTHIVNQANVSEAMEEIAEYVTDPDASVARAAVSAIGKFGVKARAGRGPSSQLRRLPSSLARHSPSALERAFLAGGCSGSYVLEPQ
eukprot:3133252-Pleurochrysis_carterae.AAC.4